MRIVIQRVSEAHVDVGGTTVGSIRTGLVVLLGVSKTDTQEDADYLSSKVVGLRIFPDEQAKMNRSVLDSGGAILVISQFTLYGDCRRGRRPSFDNAAPPDRALALYNYFVETIRRTRVPVETGTFQATMAVHLVNEGPVTILIDSEERNQK